MPERRLMVDREDDQIPINKQCELLTLHRSGLYYKPKGESSLNLELMRLIDMHFLVYPFKGTRRMREWLQDQGYKVSRERIQRLYLIMGLETIHPKQNLSKSDPAAYKYPYLLKGLSISRPNQVWAVDITYIPMAKGFMYVAAIIDLHSRYIVNWSLSNTLEAAWVVRMIREAIARHGRPDIINSDQGIQFTSELYIQLLKDQGIKISMDGKGRAKDNIFIERLWRSLKYEYVYLNPATDGLELYQGLKEWFEFYNHERHHQKLGYRKPVELYRQAA